MKRGKEEAAKLIADVPFAYGIVNDPGNPYFAEDCICEDK